MKIRLKLSQFVNTAVSTAGSSIVAVVSPAPRALLLVSLVGLAASFRAPHRIIEVAMSEYTRAADVAVGDVVIVWRGDSKLDFTRRFRHAELERHAGAPCAFTRVSASVERRGARLWLR